MVPTLSPPLLLDNSAWSRLEAAALPDARALEIAAAVTAGTVVVCLPFLLEAGYSARSADHHDALLAELLALPWAELDAEVERRAIAAQRRLARVGHHRLPPVDILIAALADRHGLGVLHYDSDYEVLAERTSLEFDSVWLAPRGTL